MYVLPDSGYDFTLILCDEITSGPSKSLDWLHSAIDRFGPRELETSCSATHDNCFRNEKCV